MFKYLIFLHNYNSFFGCRLYTPDGQRQQVYGARMQMLELSRAPALVGIRSDCELIESFVFSFVDTLA